MVWYQYLVSYSCILYIVYDVAYATYSPVSLVYNGLYFINVLAFVQEFASV